MVEVSLNTLLKRLSALLGPLTVVALLCFLLIGCAQKLEPEEPCNFVQNSQQQRVSWKGQTPIVMFIHESVPEGHRQAIVDAMSRWEHAMKMVLFKYGGVKVGAATPAKEGESVIYWFKTWSEEKRTEQARTTIYWTGDRITEADIYINDKNFDYFSDASDCEPGQTELECRVLLGKVDLESLLVHELGHVLGLQHNSQNGSVMFESLSSGTKRREPNPVDLESLKCEYE